MARRSSRQKRDARPGSHGIKPRGGNVSTAFFSQYRELLQALLIVAAGLWIFWPVLHGDWLIDDDLYLTKNPLLRDFAGLWKLWFEPGSFIEYYPIEETVQWVQWQLWHADSFGYHVSNIILHLLGGLLVWKLLAKFGLRLAWLGGLLFVIHPAMVESVAWIAEFKNTLSLPPFLLAMCAYIDYEEHHRRDDYFHALGWFLVAMLCKISMALFPVVILLYVWWKRDRIGWNDLKASAPFFAISLVLGVTTVLAGDWYEHSHHLGALLVPLGGFFSRLACAGLTITFYFSKFFWPGVSLPVYPQWGIDPSSFLSFLPWPILGAVFYLFWQKRQSWGRHVLLGLGFFLINLAPFVGFIAATYMAFTWVMDHFLYIPAIGLIGLVVAALGQISSQLTPSIRSWGIGVLAIMLGFLAWESRAYAEMFVNQETLWTYTLERNPTAWVAHYNLGVVLDNDGQTSDAIKQYGESLRLNPVQSRPHNNLGTAFIQLGRMPDAIEQYEEALKIDPEYAEAYYNLGSAFILSNRLSEAITQFEKALEIDPNFVNAHNNLGSTLLKLGRISEAIDQYKQALAIDPHHAEAHKNLIQAEAIESSGGMK